MPGGSEFGYTGCPGNESQEVLNFNAQGDRRKIHMVSRIWVSVWSLERVTGGSVFVYTGCPVNEAQGSRQLGENGVLSTARIRNPSLIPRSVALQSPSMSLSYRTINKLCL